jgi:hypothetical protein
MLSHRLLIAVRSILVGWAAVFVLTYAAERPLLLWTAALVGAHWVATAKLSLDCFVLAATGWIIGRLHRSAPVFGATAFAAALALYNFDPLLEINVAGLIRLAADALRQPGYWGPLATIGLHDAFLFGSLMAGALLSRPPAGPLSLFHENVPRG